MSKTSKGLLILNQGDNEELDGDHCGDLAIEERKNDLKLPPLYQVVMLDDDFTPMDFVVEVLLEFFYLNREKATQIMLTVHTKGKAACGVYSKDVAETKVAQVIQYARENQHPLLCRAEAVES